MNPSEVVTALGVIWANQHLFVIRETLIWMARRMK